MFKYFLGLLTASFILSNISFAQPKIEIIGGDTYDWKKVKIVKDEPLKAKIKIKNAGNEKLEITNVRPGCGCTTAPLDKNSLGPGEVATMDVSLKVSAGSGQVTKSITITSNDPQNGTKVLYLKADVFKTISVTPQPYFSFTEMVVGKEESAKLNIKNNGEKEVTFSDLEITPNNVSISLKNKFTLKPGQETEVVAKAKPEKKGYFSFSVKMKTTDPDTPELTIQGYGNVKDSPLFNSN